MVHKQANDGDGGGCVKGSSGGMDKVVAEAPMTPALAEDVTEGGGHTSSTVPVDISPALSSHPSHRPPTDRTVHEELSCLEMRGSSALESACQRLRASLSLRKLAIRWERCVLAGQRQRPTHSSSVAVSLACAQYQLRANARRVLRNCSAPVSIVSMLRAARTR